MTPDPGFVRALAQLERRLGLLERDMGRVRTWLGAAGQLPTLEALGGLALPEGVGRDVARAVYRVQVLGCAAAPLAGATVAFQLAGTTLATATTDGAGQAAFSADPGPTYHAAISATGYLDSGGDLVPDTMTTFTLAPAAGRVCVCGQLADLGDFTVEDGHGVWTLGSDFKVVCAATGTVTNSYKDPEGDTDIATSPSGASVAGHYDLSFHWQEPAAGDRSTDTFQYRYVLTLGTTTVQFYLVPKGDGRTSVVVMHLKLSDGAAVERSRAQWRVALGALARLLIDE